MKKHLRILASIVLLLVSSQVFAWGDLGHKATAIVAEQNLTENGKKFIYSILGPLPLYHASVLADEVRPDERYSDSKKHRDFRPYHFIEIPPEQTPEEWLRASVGKENADAFISQGPKFLARPSVSREAKMFYLSFLVHLVGDVHQPLHVGNGWDMGANLCDVIWTDPFTGKKSKASLHSVWDEKIFDYVKKDFLSKTTEKNHYFSAFDIVSEIKPEQNAEQLKKSAELPPLDWYKESQKLHSQVYPDKSPVDHPKNRNYCKYKDPKTLKIEKGKYDENQLPELDEAYMQRSIRLAKQQVLTGGMRLARIINDLAEMVPAKNVEENALDNLLQSIRPEKEEAVERNLKPKSAETH